MNRFSKKILDFEEINDKERWIFELEKEAMNGFEAQSLLKNVYDAIFDRNNVLKTSFLKLPTGDRFAIASFRIMLLTEILAMYIEFFDNRMADSLLLSLEDDIISLYQRQEHHFNCLNSSILIQVFFNLLVRSI